jgi:hypothetical protein
LLTSYGGLSEKSRIDDGFLECRNKPGDFPASEKKLSLADGGRRKGRRRTSGELPASVQGRGMLLSEQCIQHNFLYVLESPINLDFF